MSFNYQIQNPNISNIKLGGLNTTLGTKTKDAQVFKHSSDQQGFSEVSKPLSAQPRQASSIGSLIQSAIRFCASGRSGDILCDHQDGVCTSTAAFLKSLKKPSIGGRF